MCVCNVELNESILKKDFSNTDIQYILKYIMYFHGNKDFKEKKRINIEDK